MIPDPIPGLYCPRCRRATDSNGRLCPDCGEGLRRRGYCPVCEAELPLPPGGFCPKHEIELVDGPETIAADVGSARLVTVATYGMTNETVGPRLRLEAEGIPTFLVGERMGVNAIYQVATGGVKLQVPETLADEARVILAQSWSPPKSDDPDDAWEGLETHPVDARKRVMKGAILLFLFGPLVVTVVYHFLTWFAPR